VPQVLGQRLSQVVLIEHQQPAESSRRRVPMILSQMAFALGACGGWRESWVCRAKTRAPVLSWCFCDR
jgi:hypothetical protein